MAVLPIFNRHLFTSVFGVMSFPGDMGKAELCASWLLARGDVRLMIEENGPGYGAAISAQAAELAQYYAKWSKAREEGSIVGAVTFVMVSLVVDHPNLASWERATLALIDNSKSSKLNRSQILSLKASYKQVYHLWAAWYDNKGVFRDEFNFYAKAMRVHRIIAGWCAALGQPVYDAFEVPVFPGASDTLEHTISPVIVPDRKAAGRPRKSPS
jgi:hypothetical protein